MKNKIKAMAILSVMLLTVLSCSVSAAILKYGSSGAEVVKLQKNLNGLAYNIGTPDGVYGAKTADAVKRFQLTNALKADGVAGDSTLSKIKLKVKGVQSDLKSLGYLSTVDGIYGTATTNAVKKLQKDYYLTPDGIAGAKTLQKIAALKNNSVSGYSRTASNVVTYSLKSSGDKMLTKNFSVKEFACSDGSDTVLIDTKLAALLQEIRNHFGKPVTINSAYRTSAYNKKVGGSSKSLHLTGKAADIKIDGVSPYEIAKYCQSLGVKGIGLYNTFVHVDTRATKYYWRTNSNTTYQVSGF